MGRKMAPATVRVATGAQLWRLNQLGRLRLVDEEGEPVTSAVAKAELARLLAEMGRERFTRPGESYPVDRPLTDAA